jgi:methionyl-tRNA formyltransferase
VKIVFLTTDDPLYLPAFYERVLDRWASATDAVYIVPPLYKGQSSLDAACRYYRTFGFRDTVGLVTQVVRSKLARRSIAAVCRKRGVACETVSDVNAPEFLQRLRAIGPDVLVSVSCPQIFRRSLIELAPSGCLNVHGAILPQYRGVMPSFWMLANGETRAGVSIYLVNEQIDAGDLCGQRVFDIFPEETLDQFLRRSKAIAADLMGEVLEAIQAGTITRTPMDLARGSYYSWPTRDAVERFRARGRRVW